MVYIVLSMDAITMTMTPIVIAVIVGEERVGMQKGLELLCPRRIFPYTNGRFVLIYLDYNTTWQRFPKFPVIRCNDTKTIYIHKELFKKNNFLRIINL